MKNLFKFDIDIRIHILYEKVIRKTFPLRTAIQFRYKDEVARELWEAYEAIRTFKKLCK